MPYLILAGSVLIALLILRFSMGRLQPTGRLDAGFSSIPGNRQINADVCDWAHYGDELLYVAAGGIGRSRKGLNAASEAVKTIVQIFEIAGCGENPAYFFQRAFQGANAAILARIVDGTAGASILCTIVRGGMLYYASSGNCRLSVYRHGDLIPLSEGHTLDVLAREAFRKGQLSRIDAIAALKEKRLYNFVGQDGFKRLELFDVPVALKQKDILLLATDGVSDFCTIRELEDILKRYRKSQRAADEITHLLEQKKDPDQDNASVIVVRVNSL